MKVAIDPEALAWIRKRGISSLIIKEVVSRGGCCGGAVRGVLVESGLPEERKRYTGYFVDGIHVHVEANIPPKAESITVVHRGFVFKFLDVEGYVPKFF